MSLQISENNEVFYLNGKLNTVTAKPFMIHFESIIAQLNIVVINIDNVNEIDKAGLEAIRTLKALTFKGQKMFSIQGNGCKEIYDHFSQTDVA